MKETCKRLRTRAKQDESESKTLTQHELTLPPHFPDTGHHENSSKLTMTDSKSMHLDRDVSHLKHCVAQILKMTFIKIK